ncbi:hypothetical protein ACFX2B_040517 [Malus domestica]
MRRSHLFPPNFSLPGRRLVFQLKILCDSSSPSKPLCLRSFKLKFLLKLSDSNWTIPPTPAIKVKFDQVRKKITLYVTGWM